MEANVQSREDIFRWERFLKISREIPGQKAANPISYSIKRHRRRKSIKNVFREEYISAPGNSKSRSLSAPLPPLSRLHHDEIDQYVKRRNFSRYNWSCHRYSSTRQAHAGGSIKSTRSNNKAASADIEEIMANLTKYRVHLFPLQLFK